MANGSNFYSWRPPPRTDITSSNPGETPSPTTSPSNTPAACCASKSNPAASATARDTSASSTATTSLHPYTLDDVDLFATYIIPVTTWYLIPAAVILKPTVKVGLTLYPVTALKKDRYRYEHYREAWGLLAKTRRDLSRTSKSR